MVVEVPVYARRHVVVVAVVAEVREDAVVEEIREDAVVEEIGEDAVVEEVREDAVVEEVEEGEIRRKTIQKFYLSVLGTLPGGHMPIPI